MIQISTIAKTYAESLFNSDSNYTEILSGLNTVLEVVKSSDEFVQTIQNPSISIDTKFEIIDEVFSSELDNKIINFLKILVEKNRFSDFEQIVIEYSNLLDELNNVKKVDVISAIELNEEQKQKTIKKLESKLQKNIKINWTLNKDIIGGLVIKIDDDVIDNSLKNKLEKLSKI